MVQAIGNITKKLKLKAITKFLSFYRDRRLVLGILWEIFTPE